MDKPYTSAHNVKEAMLKENSEAQRHQFQLIRVYAERLVEIDPAAIGTLKRQADRGGEERFFHSGFVAPGAARNALFSMLKFVAVDGTFTKSRFVQILVMAIGIDAEDQLVILAQASIPNECEEI